MLMNMDKQSKVLYISTVALLSIGLGVAVIGPILSDSPAPVQVAAVDVPAPEPPPDPLTAFAAERMQLRESERAALKEIMDDPDAEPALAAVAGHQLVSRLEWADQEMTIEGVLRARGYRDCVVTIRRDSANVLIRGDTPTRSQAAQILELVSRETGLGGGNIKVIPVG